MSGRFDVTETRMVYIWKELNVCVKMDSKICGPLDSTDPTQLMLTEVFLGALECTRHDLTGVIGKIRVRNADGGISEQAMVFKESADGPDGWCSVGTVYVPVNNGQVELAVDELEFSGDSERDYDYFMAKASVVEEGKAK